MAVVPSACLETGDRDAAGGLRLQQDRDVDDPVLGAAEQGVAAEQEHEVLLGGGRYERHGVDVRLVDDDLVLLLGFVEDEVRRFPRRNRQLQGNEGQPIVRDGGHGPNGGQGSVNDGGWSVERGGGSGLDGHLSGRLLVHWAHIVSPVLDSSGVAISATIGPEVDFTNDRALRRLVRLYETRYTLSDTMSSTLNI